MSNKKKILFVQLVNQGGSYKSLFDIITFVKSQNYEIYLLVGREFNFNDPIKSYLNKVYYIRLGQLSNHTYTNSLRLMMSLPNLLIRIPFDLYSVIKILRTENIDVVYINVSNLISVAIASKLMKKKVIWHVREVIKNNVLGYLHHKIIQHFSDVIICNSNTSALNFRKKVNIIPNSININETKIIRSKEVIRKELGIKDEAVITIIGTLTKKLAINKGYYFFIELCKTLVDLNININFSFWILGKDDYKNPPNDEKTKLEDFSKKLKVYTFCKFLGFKENIFEIINASDIIVIPNLKEEGFGRVIIEAWSLGKPVVASRIQPNIDLIKDKFNGILAEPNDKADFANKIIKLLKNEIMYNEISKNAINSCYIDYNQINVNKRLLLLLSNL